jgi:hypothetical protein
MSQPSASCAMACCSTAHVTTAASPMLLASTVADTRT